MSPNEFPTEQLALVGVIDPDLNGANVYSSNYIDMAKYDAVMGIVCVGQMGTSGTVDARFVQSTDDSGSGSEIITASAITQLTQAGGDSDKQVIIAMRAEDMDLANDYRYLRLQLVVATSASDSGAVVLGVLPREKSASGGNVSSVAEIVTV